MKNKKTLCAALLFSAILAGMTAGCKEDKVGETVPAPPRDLAEKSLRAGKAPIAPPQAGNNNAAPANGQ